MIAYFTSLNPLALLRACPGGIAQGLVWGIMALGVYLTFRMLDFADLSVDGSMATGGAVCIMLIMNGWNPEAALLVSFLAGLLAGIITGLLHTLLGIPAILAGILTQISLYSINLNILGGKSNQAINVNSVSLRITSNASLLPRTILLLAIVCLVIIGILYWYLGTEHGSALRATGNNPNMSRAQGISTKMMTVIALALSNGLVALSGGILSQYQGFADVNMGRGAIVIGLAAVIIGEVLGEAILGKHLNFFLRLAFVVVGGIIYYLVYVFVLWLKFPANDMKLLTAIVVAIFLAVPYLQGRSKSSFSKVAKRNAKNAKEGK
ncbi:MAG: ABC transporter permease [Oscillospiraceae bacterium]|nr:ABC transporter permease [Oscillospiraceae bacterium]